MKLDGRKKFIKRIIYFKCLIKFSFENKNEINYYL